MKEVLKKHVEAAGYTFYEEKTGDGWKQSHIKYTKFDKVSQHIPELDIENMISHAILREVQLINKTVPVSGVYVDEEKGWVYVK